jgi:hypothetical protein
MLRHKNTTIISELKNYCISNEKSLQTFFTVLRSLRISGKMFQTVDKINNQYSCLQKFILLILFPLFDVKDISHYNESTLYQLYNCEKDVFYRFAGNTDFPWRKLACYVNLRLLKRKVHCINCINAEKTFLPFYRQRRFSVAKTCLLC